MAEHVFVVNDDSNVYREEFKGNEVAIKPHGKIKMPRREAVLFLSRMPPPNSDGGFQVKNLRIEKIDGEKNTEPTKFVCNLDGQEFETQMELDAHLETLKDKNITMDEVNGKVSAALASKGKM